MHAWLLIYIRFLFQSFVLEKSLACVRKSARKLKTYPLLVLATGKPLSLNESRDKQENKSGTSSIYRLELQVGFDGPAKASPVTSCMRISYFRICLQPVWWNGLIQAASHSHLCRAGKDFFVSLWTELCFFVLTITPPMCVHSFRYAPRRGPGAEESRHLAINSSVWIEEKFNFKARSGSEAYGLVSSCNHSLTSCILTTTRSLPVWVSAAS